MTERSDGPGPARPEPSRGSPGLGAGLGAGLGTVGDRPALHAMLEARSVALVGASQRPASLGARMLAEVARSPAHPAIYPVNPRYDDLHGRRCYPSLADLPEPADLVLLGVPDAALEAQLTMAADLGCRSAVIFGNAHEDPSRRPSLRQRLTAIAASAGMELCGAGCMGFANAGYGLRAMGYIEPDPLPAGPVALVTHSGSVFSALLRTRRAFGFTLAVSSGQELVTAAASYLSYALDQPETRVLALVLEAIRQPEELRRVLASAARRDLPVVLLTAGNSASGKAMVAAHSGALAGPAAAGKHWRAPMASTGSAISPSWPTPWSCSPCAAGPAAARTRAGRRHTEAMSHRLGRNRCDGSSTLIADGAASRPCMIQVSNARTPPISPRR